MSDNYSSVSHPRLLLLLLPHHCTVITACACDDVTKLLTPDSVTSASHTAQPPSFIRHAVYL